LFNAKARASFARVFAACSRKFKRQTEYGDIPTTITFSHMRMGNSPHNQHKKTTKLLVIAKPADVCPRAVAISMPKEIDQKYKFDFGVIGSHSNRTNIVRLFFFPSGADSHLCGDRLRYKNPASGKIIKQIIHPKERENGNR